MMKVFESTKKNIRKDSIKKNAKLFPKSHLWLASGLAGVLLAATMATHSEKTLERVSQHIDLQLATPIITPENTGSINTQASKAAIAPAIAEWRTEIVKSGDSLSFLFNRAGLSDLALQQFLSGNKNAGALKRIYPGQKFEFNITDGALVGLRYQKNRLNHVEFTKTDKGFVDTSVAITPDTRTAYREATIINSLFLAGTDVGLEQNSIMELANIFGWDIDFALDIRANDAFKVLYEERFVNGEKIGNGPILAAEFTNQKKNFKAVRYTDPEGNTSYYTPEGKSMKKAFLRTPVDFARISSHFNLKRKHPILNRIRAHKGTDYAAPTGTPIKAAGNGKVEFAGTKGGYGRTVVLRHGQSYKTLYAHMHKYGKGIRTGARVKQGQVIGYVGKSGLATGPHLHYEFYKNGVVRNPVRVELPKAKSISKSLLANFTLETQPLVAQLAGFSSEIQLASSEKAKPTTTN
ncbi:MAG: murein DD-endopeptidase MepM/ murein hydrolase activator NlpD [Candidatus Endobugula sp.]|jgi:murein DD-endopeptidase MepM/ murein hydrolase activator NlpD